MIYELRSLDHMTRQPSVGLQNLLFEKLQRKRNSTLIIKEAAIDSPNCMLSAQTVLIPLPNCRYDGPAEFFVSDNENKP